MYKCLCCFSGVLIVLTLSSCGYAIRTNSVIADLSTTPRADKPLRLTYSFDSKKTNDTCERLHLCDPEVWGGAFKSSEAFSSVREAINIATGENRMHALININHVNPNDLSAGGVTLLIPLLLVEMASLGLLPATKLMEVEGMYYEVTLSMYQDGQLLDKQSHTFQSKTFILLGGLLYGGIYSNEIEETFANYVVTNSIHDSLSKLQ